jgi:hypothetical protein
MTSDIPEADPDALPSIAQLLAGGPLPDTITAALLGGGGTDPKLPPLVGD